MTQPPPLPLDYALPARHESRWGKGFLSLCGSMAIWGLGHWMAGYRRRALGWFAIFLLLEASILLILMTPAVLPAALVVAPLALLLQLSVLIDSFLLGRRSTRPMLVRPIFRYLAGFGLLVLASLLGRAGVAAYHVAGVHTYRITSVSMRPTLTPGDRILTNRTSNVGRWDLIVFHPPLRGDIFTERVVGLPGEKVEIMNGVVRVNDVAVVPPAAIGPYASINSNFGPHTGCVGNPIHLRADEYFVLGDNSPIAYDSRYWATAAPGHTLGAVPRESIVGRVTAIYWPLKRLHKL